MVVFCEVILYYLECCKSHKNLLTLQSIYNRTLQYLCLKRL